MQHRTVILFTLFLVDIFLFFILRFPRSTTSLITPLNTVPVAPLSSPTPQATPNSAPTAIVGLVGDLGLGRHITSTARAKNNFFWSFKEISPWLLQNDFTLANLESPVIQDCPVGVTGTFTFCGDTRFLPQLQKHRFVLNLNNNHILNYGPDGLNQTKSYLSTDYFYDNFYTKTINEIIFGFLGYDFITYPKTDVNHIINSIKTHKPAVDWLIVSLHWGNEYLSQPESWRITLAHQLVDAGADIIHGHHPHVWQAPEIYNNRPIFYSFGNFIFDQSWSLPTSHSQIARLTLTKDKIIKQEMFPIQIQLNSQPALMP